LQDRIDDVGHLLWTTDPHGDAGYIVALSPRMCGRRDDVAVRRNCHREISMIHGEAAGPMRDDDQAEAPCSQRRIVGHLHFERYPTAERRRQPTEREGVGHEERSRRRGGGIPESDRERLPGQRVLHIDLAITHVPGRLGSRHRRGPEKQDQGQQESLAVVSQLEDSDETFTDNQD